MHIVFVGASLSEPHTDEFAVEFVYIIGASLSEPHIDEFAVEFLSLSIYMYIYISYVVP